jgi:hypothetical protein
LGEVSWLRLSWVGRVIKEYEMGKDRNGRYCPDGSII